MKPATYDLYRSGVGYTQLNQTEAGMIDAVNEQLRAKKKKQVQTLLAVAAVLSKSGTSFAPAKNRAAQNVFIDSTGAKFSALRSFPPRKGESFFHQKAVTRQLMN